MRQSKDQNRLSQIKLGNVQLFIKVGKDRYIPVTEPDPGEALFIWDQERHRIVPLDENGGTP